MPQHFGTLFRSRYKKVMGVLIFQRSTRLPGKERLPGVFISTEIMTGK